MSAIPTVFVPDYSDILVQLMGESDDEDYDLTEKKQNRILKKLRREAIDPEIESHDIGDLHYSAQEARFVR